MTLHTLPQTHSLNKLSSLSLIVSLCLLAFISAGCEKTLLRSQSPEKSAKDDKFVINSNSQIEPDFIGDHTTFSGLNWVLIEGVGLINGLANTGEDPAISQYRSQLLDDMRRRNILEPNEVLKSPTTALVIVRGYLPPLIQPGDKFDLEVRVPERSAVTSLDGGWLMETRLSEQAIVPGKGILTGDVMAEGSGPVLISISPNAELKSAKLTRGRIVGGAHAKTSRTMQILLNNDWRSYRNAKRVEERIGSRFFSYNKYGNREPLAKAKTDQKIELQVHPRYKDNFARYMQVIQAIAFRENPKSPSPGSEEIDRKIRMERLEKELYNPEKSEFASLQLEAIGDEAIPHLKRGLSAPTLECRFYSAVALAYLGKSDGLAVLHDAAKQEPAFRVFAYAAMAASDDGEAFLYLRQLIDEESLEARYGAFRTMTVIDDRDPYVTGETINNQFKLHVLETSQTPMVHLTHQQKTEVVLFGTNIKLKTPALLRAGTKILIKAEEGKETVRISKITTKDDAVKVVPNTLQDIIRAIGELDGSYPDVAQFIVQADYQYNLTAKIGIDQLPLSGRVYERQNEGLKLASHQDSKPKKATIGRSFLAPNLFQLQSEEKDALKPEFNAIPHMDDPGVIKSKDMKNMKDSTKNENKTDDGQASLTDTRKSPLEDSTRIKEPNFFEKIQTSTRKLMKSDFNEEQP
jgi:hypothetical protein